MKMAHIFVPLMNFKAAGSPQLGASNLIIQHSEEVDIFNDTQTGMLLGIPRCARCVQRFDDSLNSAIHITYRISLRSSSMREPRDPLLKVVFITLYRYK